MEIFIDSANIKEIEKWLAMGVVDGVTTNPTIMFKDCVYDIEVGAKRIAALLDPLPLSVEVVTNNLDEMLSQAELFSSWAPNIVVKIPQITQDGIPCCGVINALENRKIKVNATATLSLGQVILAAKAGATYISIFFGRVADEGGNATEVIINSVKWIERWGYKSKIIVGSIRSTGDILSSAMTGAHALTIPPQLLSKMVDHKYTRETVKQFVNDAQKAKRMMDKAITETTIK
ncbi:MAG: transaldolase family protein [Dehalococcoidales bacterium]|jgi:transaldolase|nr:transaldolase family protein [Dehalococcoidales bacterium]|tara:strand:- start:1788 stop:2486 length:699 start_codon:yes stop_codon:yes gene_type:complete